MQARENSAAVKIVARLEKNLNLCLKFYLEIRRNWICKIIDMCHTNLKPGKVQDGKEITCKISKYLYIFLYHL